MIERQIVIDANGGVFGRVAAFAAKQSLLGKSVIIVNCNDVLITGARENTLERYSRNRKRGGSGLQGPKVPNIPERMMKRAVRGMLSHKQGRGHDAWKRVMCYNTTPAEYESVEKISLKKRIITKAMTLKEVAKGI
jgi:ribosomal protein uL13